MAKYEGMTTIWIQKTTRDKLHDLKRGYESLDQVLTRLISTAERGE